MAKYNVYHGKFVCHECKAEVLSARMYGSEKKMTWMCPDKHISSVNLQTKKSKKDFEDEAQQ